MTAKVQSDSFSDNSPTRRGEIAGRRAEQLNARRQELADGTPPSIGSADAARLHAEESLERARSAHRASAERHVEAGNAHRQAAAVHEQAAMLADDGEGDFHQDAAARHRGQAVVHDAAATVEQEKGTPH